jgi:ferrous iron transport protein B
MNAARADIARHVALVGNPNCGKTALFNQLTGSRQKVANYAGVTVERKEGRFTTASGQAVRVLDLPGTYSFDATSPDEQITRDVCKGHHPAEPKPDLLVCVADATNLRLHLRFVLEVRATRPADGAGAEHDGRGGRNAAFASMSRSCRPNSAFR